MLRQYRIEKSNGMEFVLQESFRKYTWTKKEFDKFSKLVEHLSDVKEIEAVRNKFREENEIPIYCQSPCVVIRAAVFNSKPVEFYISSDPSEVSPVVQSELNEFLNIFDGHWRNMISCQRDRYGELFASSDD